jgi:hypothetical protein
VNKGVELVTLDCPNCLTQGVLPMSDNRCPNCKQEMRYRLESSEETRCKINEVPTKSKIIDFVPIAVLVLFAAFFVLHIVIGEIGERVGFPMTGPCPGCEAFAQEMAEEAAQSKE